MPRMTVKLTPMVQHALLFLDIAVYCGVMASWARWGGGGGGSPCFNALHIHAVATSPGPQTRHFVFPDSNLVAEASSASDRPAQHPRRRLGDA